MMPQAPRGRAGITLTEILISILIMGVGLVSLATLFPLGLLRLRDAQRYSRSGYLVESAASELEARNLLGKASFQNQMFSPWYFPSYTSIAYDPWVRDTPSLGGNPANGVSRSLGSAGLPVAYDPLWIAMANSLGVYPNTTPEARFGSGINYIRNDPNPNTTASVWGLPRVTNFYPGVYDTAYATNPTRVQAVQAVVSEIFVSPEDIVLQSDAGAKNARGLSPIVPNLQPNTTGVTAVYQNDWRYSWMFTGQQSDAASGAVFDGDVVIFENRPFAIDTVSTPFGGTAAVVSGELTVEAVFGFASVVQNLPNDPTGTLGVGTGVAANRTVLLRWPTTMPDPEVRVGGWIADVTYERILAVETARTVPGDQPLQRCHWYQVTKKSTPFPHSFANTDPANTTFRAMTVWIGSDLKAQTLLSTKTGEPNHVNAALVSPYVVYTFPRTIYSR